YSSFWWARFSRRRGVAMPLPPGASRWVPHFENPDLEHFARNTFNGIKDLNAAIKALNPKTNAAQAQANANTALIAGLQTQIQNITDQITNITNITNNFTTVGLGVGLDCGTFSGY